MHIARTCIVFFALSQSVLAQQGVYFDCHKPDPHNPPHLRHPHVDGVFLRFTWADLEPEPGEFDFSVIERDVAPWVSAGKKVLIGIKPAGQHNRSTPQWVSKSIPSIPYIRKGKNSRVSVPKYWDAEFLPAARGLIHALGKRYDGDQRIEAVMVGVGHLGFLTAAPNAGGAEAFLAAGWTPERWKTYTFGLLETYKQAFPSKPLFIRGSDLLLRIPEPARFGFPQSKPFFNDVRDEILLTAATRYGVGVGMNGLESDAQEFLRTGVPHLYAHLAEVARSGRVRLELSDDWPIWVDAQRRRVSSVDRGKDGDYFTRALENAIGGVRGIPRTNISWIKLLEPDLDCTDPKHPQYDPECEQALLRLKRELLRGN